MSDPVTDVEIEDVLSSIRRLVGNEHRVKASPKPVELPNKPTRLVLTPSLLVPVPDEPENEPEADQMPESNPDHAGTGPEPDDAESRESDQSETAFGALGPDLDQDNEPAMETGADIETDADAMPESPTSVPQETPETEAEADQLSQEPAEEQADLAAQDGSQTPWHDPDTTLFEAGDMVENSDDMPATVDQQKAEDGFVVDETGPSAISDISDVDQDDAPAEDDAPLAPDLGQIGIEDGMNIHNSAQLADLFTDDDDDDPFRDDLKTDAALEEAPEAPDDTTDPEDDVPYSTATLSAKIAALEAKIGQTQDQWEPDGELGDDYAGTRVETIEWQDHHGEGMPEPRRPALDPAALNPEFASPPPPGSGADTRDKSEGQHDGADRLDILGEDDAILDEESLRELVADIVRQELQGALGERITRNVRKLVRREIHRALTAQELD